MCGISGFYQRDGTSSTRRDIIERMSGAIAHRGPDSAGFWMEPTHGMVLGHRRLSILDLSPAGHQPMLSACQRFVLVFNGEIYNHQTLREQLQNQGAAPAWRGHSDT